MSKSLKSSRMKSERQERIGYMLISEIPKDKTVGRLALALSAFVAIVIKITFLIMFKSEKFTAALLNVHVKCSTMYQFVSLTMQTIFDFSWLVGSKMPLQAFL